MDAFDYADAQKAPPPRKFSAIVWNVLTMLILLCVVCIGVVFLMIFLNPGASLNPFKPIEMPTEFILPTSTPTRKTLPPTWTPTVTPLPSATYTPRPTNTTIPSNTPYGATTDTPGGPTDTPGPMSFALLPGDPQAISADVYHPGIGCAWMGVSGLALDKTDKAIEGLVVQLGGTLEGRTFEPQMTLTGLGSSDGRYEFTIADHPIASDHTLWVQLFDQSGLVPMSEKIPFSTYAECDKDIKKNLIIINFKQIR
jgi:hypothetical protein